MIPNYSKASIMLDKVPLDIDFVYCSAEPENGAPEDYDICNVYLHNSIFDISGLLSDDAMARIVKQLEKQKGEI